MRKVLSLLFVSVLCLGLLSGCASTEIITYQRTEALTIQGKNNEESTIPYNETMTVTKKGSKAIGGSDSIVYHLNDKYFEKNEDAKDELLRNLASGLLQTYQDENTEAVTVETSVSGDNNEELHALVKVDFKKLKTLNECVALFGLTEEDFNSSQEASFDTVDTIMTNSGFEKTKTVSEE